MPIRRRTVRRLLPLSLLLLLFADSALSQNLLVNPGFDRDLGGWTSRTETYPDPAHGDLSATWTPTDAAQRAASGGLALHAWSRYHETASVALGQCLAFPEKRLALLGGTFLTARQFATAGTSVAVTFFAEPDCSGIALGSGSATSLPFAGYPETSSHGAWLSAESMVLSSPGTRSVRFDVTANSVGTGFYGAGYVDAVADDVYLLESPASGTTWMIPSAAWVHGAAGSYWTTRFTLSNPGSTDAAVTFKWLGHDVDGRSGIESAYVVRAGQTFSPAEETWWVNHPENWGAILVTSSSPSLVVQSETSTPVPGGGTVGQAVPALGSADFAGASPKAIAPVRENASFRTNLVLANAVEFPITVHVALLAADGALAGARDVDLPPLGMTQLTRVAVLLGAPTLDLGQISVSTTTPGGLVAAYASVIDNVTNDPRTLMPQDAAPAANGPNLVVNPTFDRDLSGWTLTLSGSGAFRSGAWDPKDSSGDARSGSAYLAASYDPGTTVGSSALLRQCVAVVSGRVYGLQATVGWSSGGIFGLRPLPHLRFSFYASGDCTGESLAGSADVLYQVASPTPLEWLVVPARPSVAPMSARSASVELSVGAAPFGGVNAYFDDVVFSEGPSIWTPVVPAAASINGAGGSFWTTTITLANPTSALATAYLYGPAQNLLAGHMQSIPDIIHGLFGLNQTWQRISFDVTSPAVAVTAETSTPAQGGGTVGQALAAFREGDLVGSTPKSIAPIRDNGAFRTNLVLANVTSVPLVAHVNLFDAAGSAIGSVEVPLDVGVGKQIGAVGSTLSGGHVDTGRISVSTDTPGGKFAAYASVIDNVTNDPRTILPR